MKVSISLQTWMQCGFLHVKCGCNVDPPHLHNLNVDVMWSHVDVLWSNVDFPISNVNKCRYIVGHHNGDLRLFSDKLEINVVCHTKNVDPPHLHILTMWILHISTFSQCGITTPTHFFSCYCFILRVHWCVGGRGGPSPSHTLRTTIFL